MVCFGLHGPFSFFCLNLHARVATCDSAVVMGRVQALNLKNHICVAKIREPGRNLRY